MTLTTVQSVILKLGRHVNGKQEHFEFRWTRNFISSTSKISLLRQSMWNSILTSDRLWFRYLIVLYH